VEREREANITHDIELVKKTLKETVENAESARTSWKTPRL